MRPEKSWRIKGRASVHNWCRPCAFHTVWVNFAQMGSSPVTQNAHQSQRLTLAGRDEREQDEAQIDASLKNCYRSPLAAAASADFCT